MVIQQAPHLNSKTQLANRDLTTGTPLTYAPALGVPICLSDPRRAVDPEYLETRLQYQLTETMPNYRIWDPFQILRKPISQATSPSSVLSWKRRGHRQIWLNEDMLTPIFIQMSTTTSLVRHTLRLLRKLKPILYTDHCPKTSIWNTCYGSVRWRDGGK